MPARARAREAPIVARSAKATGQRAAQRQRRLAHVALQVRRTVGLAVRRSPDLLADVVVLLRDTADRVAAGETFGAEIIGIEIDQFRRPVATPPSPAVAVGTLPASQAGTNRRT